MGMMLFFDGNKFETEAISFQPKLGACKFRYTGKQYWYMYGVGGLFGVWKPTKIQLTS